MLMLQSNISRNTAPEDWRCREAATYAFGSMLEGPSITALCQLAGHGLDYLLNAMRSDPSAAVRHTTAWTLGALWSCLGSFWAEPGKVLVRACRASATGTGPLLGQQDQQILCWEHPGVQACSAADTPCAGRIFEFVHGPEAMPPVVTAQNLQKIKETLINSLRDEPHIAEKVCASCMPVWCRAESSILTAELLRTAATMLPPPVQLSCLPVLDSSN